MKVWLTLSLVASFVVTSACTKRVRPDLHIKEEEFSESVQPFPFTALEARQQRILANYSSLELGMTKSEVAEIIGEPDYWSVTQFKMEEPIGSQWVYAFYCTGRFCGTNNEDRLVQIFFDLDDRVNWLAPSENLNLQRKRKL